MALSNKHHWIGLFGADGNLRDNFLMYIGTDPECAENSYCISLCALGKIQPKHLFHGGCQILAETNKGLANLASVKPFTVGDHFRLVGESEHMELVGKEDHEDELTAIKRILTRAVIKENNFLNDWHNELKQEQASTHAYFGIPALDGFLPDLHSTPEWLKKHAQERIKSGSLFEIAELIGFLSRTGDQTARKLGSNWSKSLNKQQLIELSLANTKKLFAIVDATHELESAIKSMEQNYLWKTVAMILTMRDQCESIFWIMEEAGYASLLDLSAIEEILLSSPIIFITPLKNKENWMVQMLTYIREHSPVCWWAARANLV